MNRRNRPRKKCVWCGKDYFAYNSRQKYCSSKCNMQVTNSKNKLGSTFLIESKVANCVICDAAFRVSIADTSDHMTCSKKCYMRCETKNKEMLQTRRAKFQSLKNKSYIKNAQSKLQLDRCFYCGDKPVGRRKALDHIIPLNKGGLDETGNFMLVCISCNSAKKDKLPWEFIEALKQKAYQEGYKAALLKDAA